MTVQNTVRSGDAQLHLSQDKHLRARVRLFGNLLGNILRENAGPSVYDIVEKLRTGFIKLQNNHSDELKQELNATISSLDASTSTDVLRAFNIYFSLVNIAEEAHSHFIRRCQIKKGGPLWKGSFTDTLTQFMVDGLSADNLQTLFDGLAYIPVFTAHPTEAKRRTILESYRRIFKTAEKLEETKLSKEEQRQITESLEDQIQVLWKTNEVRVFKPKVRDEIRNGLFYFRESLFSAVPEIYRNLEKAVFQSYGVDENNQLKVKVPSFLKFGSWIGGDRDGNPFVKPETTENAILLHTREILEEYSRRVKALTQVLTYSIDLSTISTELLTSLAADEKNYPQPYIEREKLFSHEPYRRKLRTLDYRLNQNLSWVEARLNGEDQKRTNQCIADENEFLNELNLIHNSLCQHGDKNIADAKLKDLIRLVETFGFFLVNLDIRQESTVHSQAISEYFQLSGISNNYLELDEDEKIVLIDKAMSEPYKDFTLVDKLSPLSAETFEVFKLIKRMRKNVSPKAIGEYVISMTHNASHILEVMLLGKISGLLDCENNSNYNNLNISPLFETIEDLAHAQPVLSKLYKNKLYRELLDASGGVQEIMLGYSDSCKDGGIIASSWNLYEAQKQIIALSNSENIKCRLFHGRGGTIGRGGGPTHESILAQPTNTVHGQIRFTEQGEVLSYKYSNLETAIYELTMGITGLMKASTGTIETQAEDRNDYLGILDEVAKIGEQTYRDLSDHTDHFLDYFYEATPVREIGMLNIGSRPSHRKQADRSKSSIRAIPWVFGWAQARHTLPAWYGLGSALENWRNNEPERLAKLQAMYIEWPYFRSLLSNIQMALYKGELNIAKEYSLLYTDEKNRALIFDKIKTEYEKTITQVLNIANIQGLLEENPTLALSLQRRDPYLTPINHIQIKLLKEIRILSSDDAEKSPWFDPLLRSINAISAGMRNTG